MAVIRTCRIQVLEPDVSKIKLKRIIIKDKKI